MTDQTNTTAEPETTDDTPAIVAAWLVKKYEDGTFSFVQSGKEIVTFPARNLDELQFILMRRIKDA